jgi:GDP-L-fucose synthase
LGEAIPGNDALITLEVVMRNWWAGRRVTVTGGHGFVGRRVVALLEQKRPAHVSTFSSREYDLTRQTDVARMYADQRPDIVIHLAARVGGIGANRENPGRFFYENAIMGIELIEQARRNGIEKFVQVGTVCAYPKWTPVPFSEDALWDGYPEDTNAPYGIAKKALLVQAQAYREQFGLNAIYLLPTNLYGPGDNFDPNFSHVIPALILKCVEAKQQGAPSLVVWGTGKPTREFLYVDDAARAILLATELYNKPAPVNVGSSQEISIKDLVNKIVELTGYHGDVVWDASKPDGQPRRKLNVERARQEFGFEAEISFDEGLKRTIESYLGSRQLLKESGAERPEQALVRAAG